jgi:hypothetical protein
MHRDDSAILHQCIILLRFLLNWSSSVGDAIGRHIARATPIRFGCSWLRIIAFIVVVLVDVHVTRSGLVMLRPLLL